MNASSEAQKRQTAKEIVTGFKEVGFIYLDKHGIPSSTVSNTFQKVRFQSFPFDVRSVQLFPAVNRVLSSSASPLM